MNDKSSRSHSVFTLVLTQTKVTHNDGHERRSAQFVWFQKLSMILLRIYLINNRAVLHLSDLQKVTIDSVTSKINLIDLAGSERQSLAKTSGDRLRVSESLPCKLVISMLKFIILMHYKSQFNLTDFPSFLLTVGYLCLLGRCEHQQVAAHTGQGDLSAVRADSNCEPEEEEVLHSV